MTFLDTVDGKLAHVTLTSSRFGHIFDHSLDLLHPPFCYLAWGLGLERLALLRYGASHIKALYDGDLDWLREVPQCR